MARLVTCGFEGGEVTLDGFTRGSAAFSYDTTTPRSGARALTATSTATANFALGTVASGTTIYARFYFRVATVANFVVARILDGASATLIAIHLNADGSVDFSDNSGSILVQTTAGAIAANTYYMVEMSVKIDTATTTDHAAFRLDGVSYYDSDTTLTNTVPATFRLLGPVDVSTVYYDDVAVNDSTGVSQTSWPGPGNIVMLTPISDNSVGTGWTLSTGTAISSNGWNSVDNEPPQGVADLTALSDAQQIRNATSNANVDYKGNTGTYLAAGLGASDTVTLCQAVIATAAPSATSAKSGNLGATNPTITLATIGTFYQGTNIAGTYPSGWKVTRSAIAYAPTPTLGSAAVLDVQQVTSSTRIAMVCFLGMVVEYVPAPAVIPPGLGPVVSMQQMFISDMSLMR